MNVIKKLAIVLSLASLASFASAKTPVEAYLETCRKDAGVPVPVAVVTPEGVTAPAGAFVELAFVVDVNGKPTNVSVKSSTDSELASASLEAVKQWRFTPATQNGKAVATKVILPIRAVEGVATYASY